MQTLNELIHEVAVGVMNATLYFAKHMRVRTSVDRICSIVSHLKHQESVPFPILIGVVEDKIIYEKKPIFGASHYARKFTAAMNERNAGGVEFHDVPEPEEVAAFLDLLSKKQAGNVDVAYLNEALSRRDIETLKFVEPFAESFEDEQANLWETLNEMRVIKVPVKLYQNLIDLLQTSAMRVARNIQVEMDSVYDVTVEVLQILSEEPEVLMSIANYEESDDFNLRHSIRVCLRTCLLAQDFITDESLLRRIGRAALLHDIGKALVPAEILFKPGMLTPTERDEINKHTVHGARILLEQSEPDPLAVHVAYSHHIMADGSGYPVAKGRFKVSPITRLIQICDVFEALTAKRPYKDAFLPKKAFTIMMRMKDKLDQPLLAHFIRKTGLYPVGSIVELTSGEKAQVTGAGTDICNPVVRTLFGFDGEPIPPEQREDLRLGDDPNDKRRVQSLVQISNLLDGLMVTQE